MFADKPEVSGDNFPPAAVALSHRTDYFTVTPSFIGLEAVAVVALADDLAEGDMLHLEPTFVEFLRGVAYQGVCLLGIYSIHMSLLHVNTSWTWVVYTLDMGKLVWKLEKVVEEYDITPARLEREIVRLGYTFGAKSIYRFMGEGPININRGSLEAIISGLRSITGKNIGVADLLEYQPEA